MRFTTLLASLLLVSPALGDILDSRSPQHGPALAAAHRRHHAKLARVPAPAPEPEVAAPPAALPAKKKKGKRCNRSSTSSAPSPTSTAVATTTTVTPAAAVAPTPTSSKDHHHSDSSSADPAPAPTSSDDPAPTTSAAPAEAAPSPSPSADSGSSGNSDSSPSSGANALTEAGISAFLGDNEGGIGSWFRTDNSGDSTDGTSWCQLHYQDTWMGTAIPVEAMINSFGGDALQAMEAYCGLEIEATNPANGNVVTMYVVDGFDQAWVLTPSSMDLTIAAFTALYGSFDNNKDTVVQNMSWRFTGNRNSAYAYNAQ